MVEVQNVEKLLYYVVSYSYLIIPLCFLFFKGKLKDTTPSILALYGLLFCGWLIYYKESPKEFRKYLQVFYTFLEYSFFTLILLQVIRNASFKIFIAIASFLFIAFQIFFVSTTTFVRLDSIPIGIETILIFIYIFYFFFDFSKQVKDTFIYNHHIFWIAVGILIYLGGSFFFYILINHLNTSEVEKFGNMTYIAEIIKNLLFAFSIFIYKKYPVNNNRNQPKNIPNLDMNMI